jgi:hypothetical protein
MPTPSLRLKRTQASSRSTADWPAAAIAIPPRPRFETTGTASAESRPWKPAAKSAWRIGLRSQEARIFAVSELVRAARITLESRFSDLRVEGEVSGLKRSANGHLYFTLKDAEAQLDCVMYAREAARLRFRLQDGQQVRCRGRLTIYEARGRFQLSVHAIEPAGAGALALAFEQLKQKLAAEGLFDPETQASPALLAAPAGRGDLGPGCRDSRHRAGGPPPFPGAHSAGPHTRAGRRRGRCHRSGLGRDREGP